MGLHRYCPQLQIPVALLARQVFAVNFFVVFNLTKRVHLEAIGVSFAAYLGELEDFSELGA